MKIKIKTIVVTLCLATVCAALAFSGCSTLSYYVDGNLTIIKSGAANIYGAGCYTYEGDGNETTIIIPDSYQGHPITQLGFSPSPYYNYFYVSLSGPCNGYSMLDYDEYYEQNGYDAEIVIADRQTVVFTVYIGGNILTLCSVSYDGALYVTGDKEVIYIQPEYYFVCSEDNKNFYSQDGLLYNKDGSLAEWKYIEEGAY
ncbi:MAG: hypothetical protein LUD27_01030 [Clostridia bacterium]|nr:hypothetical protein [Clostridia bacterium]